MVVTLINSLRTHNDKASLVYFSDHEEEVYDYEEKLFCGSNEGTPSPAIYTVSFITWASPEWKNGSQGTQWGRYVHQPFSSADFMHILPRMIGISFDGLDPTRRLVSDTFIKRERWIGSPSEPQKLVDYDDSIHSQMMLSQKTTAPVKSLTYKKNQPSTVNPKAAF
ncbi:MAG: heptose-I-phosphate ethanolaminephosphotransferase [Porticoccus sp.]